MTFSLGRDYTQSISGLASCIQRYFGSLQSLPIKSLTPSSSRDHTQSISVLVNRIQQFRLAVSCTDMAHNIHTLTWQWFWICSDTICNHPDSLLKWLVQVVNYDHCLASCIQPAVNCTICNLVYVCESIQPNTS